MRKWIKLLPKNFGNSNVGTKPLPCHDRRKVSARSVNKPREFLSSEPKGENFLGTMLVLQSEELVSVSCPHRSDRKTLIVMLLKAYWAWKSRGYPGSEFICTTPRRRKFIGSRSNDESQGLGKSKTRQVTFDTVLW